MKLTRIIQISYKELCDTLKYLWNDNYNYGLDAPVTSLHPVNRENQFNNTIQNVWFHTQNYMPMVWLHIRL